MTILELLAVCVPAFLAGAVSTLFYVSSVAVHVVSATVPDARGLIAADDKAIQMIAKRDPEVIRGVARDLVTAWTTMKGDHGDE